MGEVDDLAKRLEQDLLKLYGPLLSGEGLLKSLGYSSKEAFRQSVLRKNVPVPVFKLENRRGYFALTKEVAEYLAKTRYKKR